MQTHNHPIISLCPILPTYFNRYHLLFEIARVTQTLHPFLWTSFLDSWMIFSSNTSSLIELRWILLPHSHTNLSCYLTPMPSPLCHELQIQRQHIGETIITFIDMRKCNLDSSRLTFADTNWAPILESTDQIPAVSQQIHHSWLEPSDSSWRI